MSGQTNSHAPLRVGIVGGNAKRAWAHDAHVPALTTLPQFRIDAVAARTQSQAEEAAAAFGAPRAFGDALKLVRDSAIDVVSVTVKVPEHRAIVLAALEAEKHVYCEWPLGQTVSQSEEMAGAARRAKSSHVIIGLQALSAPAIRQASGVVAAGTIGEPRTLRIFSPTAGWGFAAPPYYAYLQDKRNGATMMTIAGGHTISVIEAIVGAYTEVDARCSILQKSIRVIGTDNWVERTCADHATIVGRHASGCVSSLELVGGQTSMPFRLEVVGSRGSLIVTAHAGGVGDFQVNELVCQCSVPIEPTPGLASPSLSGPSAFVAEAYVRFANDIHSGTRQVPDFQVALKLSRLLDAIDCASEQGRRQRI
jgi:predicted dehydrogenase